MRPGSLNRRVAELERQLVGVNTLLALPGGRAFRIAHGESGRNLIHLFCETMRAIHVCYLPDRERLNLQLSPELAAIVEAEPDHNWPTLVQRVRSMLTDDGKYSDREAVLEYLKRKVQR